MIKFNGNNINKWLKGTSQVNKVYKGEVSCYPDITNDAPTPPTPTHDYSVDYLTFRALEDGTNFSFSSSSENQIQYSVDSGSTWSTLQSEAPTPTISSGNTILWKASLTSGGVSGIGRFNSNGRFNVEGNIMSLLYGDNFSGQTDLTGKDGVFLNLFRNHSGLTSTENLVLPATTLPVSAYTAMFYNCMNLTTAPSILPSTNLSGASRCYQYMFQNCSGLTTAPALPATTLTDYCYNSMFQGCSSLTTAPSLPATTLAARCYQNMFQNCTNLNSITCLATDISASGCTNNWVYRVASAGTFTKAASMSGWGSCGKNKIPCDWTVQDYSS